MERVFNMGLGMALVVSKHFTDSILGQLSKGGCDAWKIGAIRSARGSSCNGSKRLELV